MKHFNACNKKLQQYDEVNNRQNAFLQKLKLFVKQVILFLSQDKKRPYVGHYSHQVYNRLIYILLACF